MAHVPDDEDVHVINWSIPDFAQCDEFYKESPITGISKGSLTSHWRLGLYPNGCDNEYKGYLSLFLRMIASNKTPVSVRGQIAIVNRNGFRSNIEDFDFLMPTANALGRGKPKFIKRSTLWANGNHLLLDSGALLITCILRTKVHNQVDGEDLGNEPANKKQKMANEFHENLAACSNMPETYCNLHWEQYTNQQWTDVVFNVGNRKFKLHKIVMARCPAFASMIEEEAKGAAGCHVTISDCEPEVFAELVRFIYTGVVENIEGIAEKLLRTAQTYRLEELKTICEAFLISKTLTQDNAADMFKMAVTLGAEQLRKEAVSVIVANPQWVVDNWALLDADATLRADVARGLAMMLQRCPTDKWQPPFRPSQVLYSEFPEDRGRSLDIDRQDVSRKYPGVQQDVSKRQPDRQDVSRKGHPFTAYAYEPVQSNRLPDDLQPRDYSDDYPAGGGGGSKDYQDKDYTVSYGGGRPDYPEYQDGSSSREEPKQLSQEYSSEASKEYYGNQPYTNYPDYKDDKSKERDPDDFTLEDFELDPAVMNPPPPLERAKGNSTRGSHHVDRQRGLSEHHVDHQSDLSDRPHDEVHEPTEPPTTQLEIPATAPSAPRLPTPVPIQATGYPLTRTPVPVFRNPALSLMSPNQPGWGHWKNVLAHNELANLQVMKPPPLGQAQTWLSNNFAPNQFVKRPTLIYAR